MNYGSTKERGNKFASYGSAIVFAPAILVAPFPTLVNIGHQQTIMLLSGGYYVKNILAFFSILSVIYFIRKKLLRKHILILSFLLAYLAILAQSAFALSERFHLPAMPFVLILAAYGISKLGKKGHRFFVPYIIILVLIIVAWNTFKLAGRGLV